jgi:hypothetical protein
MDKYKIKKNILDIKQTKPIFLGTDSLFWLFYQPLFFKILYFIEHHLTMFILITLPKKGYFHRGRLWLVSRRPAPLFQEIRLEIALLCNSGCGAARGGNIICPHEADESNF